MIPKRKIPEGKGGHKNLINLVGIKFNRLLVIKRALKNGLSRGAYWNCICDCGNIKDVAAGHLRSGRIKSCGCLMKESIGNTKHGLCYSREHGIWRGIKDRCYNKKNSSFHYYGGIGILMSERWKNSFIDFFADMGASPSIKHSVERLRLNEGYYKGNCIWATVEVQANNKRNSKWVDYNGEKLTAAQLCKKYNIGYFQFIKRISRKWTVDEAVKDALNKK